MKLWKTLLFAVVAVEAGKKKKKPNRAKTTTTSSSTTSSTASTTTLGSTAQPPSALAKAVMGTFVSPSGEHITVDRNSDGSFTIIVRENANGLVLAFDNAVITDDAAGTLMFTTAGTATFDPATGAFRFANGMTWSKDGTGTVTTAAVAEVAATAAATTAAAAAAATTAAAVGDNSGGNVGDNSAGSETGGDTGDNSAGSETGNNAYGDSSSSDNYGGSSGTSDTYSSGTSDTYSTGSGYVQGDPHVRVQLPHEQPLCYDIEAEAMDFVSLIDDVGIGLEINGRIEHVKESKNRLAEIGIRTGKGVEIAINDKNIQIGKDGEVDNVYELSQYQTLDLEDVHIEVLTPFEGRHNSVMVELDSGALFLISSKTSKDSMRFEVQRDYGLSKKIGGIFGQTIQPNEYTMVGNTLLVEGRTIENVNWDEQKGCFRLSEWQIPTFLGHQEKDYEVDNLFSSISKSWFTVDFLGLSVDH